MMRSLTLVMVLMALSVAGCGPRSLGREVETETVTSPASRPMPSGSTRATPPESVQPAPAGSMESGQAATGEVPSNPEPTHVPSDDGAQAAQPDVEIPDVDGLDELLADIDAVLAGIDLDADEGEMP